MKKISLIPIISAIFLFSCSKEDYQELNTTIDRIEYKVECNKCLVQFETDIWNRENELERSKFQSVFVSSRFNYSFSNKYLKEVEFKISQSVLDWRNQDVNIIVLKNKKEIHRSTTSLGADHEFSESIIVKLK